MRPANLRTKIFLDGGDPNETRQVIDLLGFLDGQTTNPTLISKNPKVAERLARGEKFTKEEILDLYKSVVQEISRLIPKGSISAEVHADANTTSQEMLKQGKEMFTWIPNAHIKYPITDEGLAAAKESIKQGMRVNMTLCFSQAQSAAVYVATKDGIKGQVFVSPFVGRLDDIGINGMILIENILRMYDSSDGHVQTLTASVRSIDHLLYAIKLGTDIITVPFKILREWADLGLIMPDENFVYDSSKLKPLVYEQLDLNKDWNQFDIYHELTRKGIEKFAMDWDSLI